MLIGFSLSFGSAEVHENCRFFFAVTVSHYSMLGPLTPCWSLAPIQYKKRLASEEGGFSLTAWASPPSKVPARRSSAPAGVGGPLADLTDLASLPSIVRSDVAARLPLISCHWHTEL